MRNKRTQAEDTLRRLYAQTALSTEEQAYMVEANMSVWDKTQERGLDMNRVIAYHSYMLLEVLRIFVDSLLHTRSKDKSSQEVALALTLLSDSYKAILHASQRAGKED